tara:strand:+ start:593 stop:808 length:216 start_codon:yes stop_codon:yes gene_type:complete
MLTVTASTSSSGMYPTCSASKRENTIWKMARSSLTSLRLALFRGERSRMAWSASMGALDDVAGALSESSLV